MGGPDALLAARLAAGDDHALVEIFDRLAPAVRATRRAALDRGGAAPVPPEITIADAVSSPDQY